MALVAVGLGGVLVLGSRFPVRLSALWAVDAALTQVIVLWPVVAGLGAADAVRLRRSGALDLLRAAPPAARVRLLIGRSVALACWAVLGLVLSVLLAVGVAAAHGSPPPWSAGPEVVLAAAGVLASALVGTAVGASRLLGARWLTPPLVTVAGYAVLALDLGGAAGAVAFVGATDVTVTAIVLCPEVLAAELTLLGCVAAIAVVAAAALHRPDDRLHDLDPDLGALRYAPGDAGRPEPGVVVVFPPIDPSGRSDQLIWDVVLGASACPDRGWQEWLDADLRHRIRAEVAVGRWLAPDLDVADLVAAWPVDGIEPPLPVTPTLDDARSALAALRGCRGAW